MKLCSGQAGVKFFLIFLVNLDTFMEKNIFGLVKKFLRVARVHKKMARVGSGWPKWPRVGSNFGSGLDPTHP